MNYNSFIEEAGALFENYCILDKTDMQLDTGKGSFTAIAGEYFLNREFNEKIYQHIFYLVVIVDKTGQLSIPIVYLPKEQRPYKFEHLYKDNSCCLGLTHELIGIWGEKQSAIDFFEKIIDPFLINLLSCRNTGKCATEERPHGEDGLADYYKDLLGMTAIECKNALFYLYQKVRRGELAKGHNPCPCGSGKKLRHCHGKQINEFLNHLYVNRIFQKAFIQDVAGYIEKRR